jgi:hypothetical protein
MSSMNALRHGLWSAAALEEQRSIKDLMRKLADFREKALG